MNNSKNSRRNFLRLATGAAIATTCAGKLANATANATIAVEAQNSEPQIIDRTTAAANADEKVLRFYNTHTHEEVKLVYWANGDYVTSSLNQLDLLLRDHREHETVAMDPKLYDQLWDLQQKIGGEEVFEIISGYRSPKTNSKLRERSSGVAKFSYHIQGRAIDIRLRGSDTIDVFKTAVELKAGGVGYYAGSDFVHLDTGPHRCWS